MSQVNAAPLTIVITASEDRPQHILSSPPTVRWVWITDSTMGAQGWEKVAPLSSRPGLEKEVADFLIALEFCLSQSGAPVLILSQRFMEQSSERLPQLLEITQKNSGLVFLARESESLELAFNRAALSSHSRNVRRQQRRYSETCASSLSELGVVDSSALFLDTRIPDIQNFAKRVYDELLLWCTPPELALSLVASQQPAAEERDYSQIMVRCAPGFLNRPLSTAKKPLLPVVCAFGCVCLELFSEQTEWVADFEERRLDVHCFESDEDLDSVLARYHPSVILSIGDIANFSSLTKSSFDIRARWLHYNDIPNNLVDIGRAVFSAHLRGTSAAYNSTDAPSLVSVFTPVYNPSMDYLLRAYSSLRRQTYTNWEWVIVDDSDDTHHKRVWRAVTGLAQQDCRVRVFRPNAAHCGVIGEVKYQACALSRGTLLAELDQDDELLPQALEVIVQALNDNPEAGFAYTDFAEVWDTPERTAKEYADGWAHGWGVYYDAEVDGRLFKAISSAPINAKTIRGLVGAPNHLRVWRRSTYLEVGGHARHLAVADDLDLLIRTFLHTRMLHVPCLAYIQYFDPSGRNTQSQRNAEIQRHIRLLVEQYDMEIHERLLELGVKDWIWNDEYQCSDFDEPNPETDETGALSVSLEWGINL